MINKLITSSMLTLLLSSHVQAQGMGQVGPGIAGENDPTQTMVVACLFHEEVYDLLEIWGTMPVCGMATRGVVYGTPSYSQHRAHRHSPGDPECFTSEIRSQ